jgi:hypothetical protein
MKLQKPPHYIHSPRNAEGREFITMLNPPCICEVFTFDNEPAALEFETAFPELVEGRLICRTWHAGRVYVIAAIQVFQPITAADQAEADRIAARFRRVAFWYLETILKSK